MALRPEIALARAASRAQNYGPRIGGGSDYGSGAAECGYLLKGVPPLGTHLVLAKYGGGGRRDREQAAALLCVVSAAAGVRFPRPNARSVRADRVLRGVVEEFISVTACEACQGRGHVWNAQLAVDCEACEGTGRASWSRRRRAAACGLSEGALRNTAWGDVHKASIRIAFEEEERALRTMARNQREKD